MADPDLEPVAPAGGTVAMDGALAQALASRICHDLVSPVGAVANGVELLRDVGRAGAVAEIDMIDQSAQRANALLRLHRLAFGTGSGAGSEIARPALARVLQDGIASHRVEVELLPVDGPALPYKTARAIGLAALCAQALLGMRGRVEVRLGAQTTLPVSVTASGADMERKGTLLDLVTGAADDVPLDPRQVEFRLLPIAAASVDARVETKVSGEQAVLTLLPQTNSATVDQSSESPAR